MAKAPPNFRSLCRGYTDLAAQVAGGILANEEHRPRDRLTAAEFLMNYGWGKPTLDVEQKGAQQKAITEIKLMIVDARHNDTKIVDVEPVLIEHKPNDDGSP